MADFGREDGPARMSGKSVGRSASLQATCGPITLILCFGTRVRQNVLAGRESYLKPGQRCRLLILEIGGLYAIGKDTTHGKLKL